MVAAITLDAAETRRLLAIPDLTDPRHGHHAMQDLVDEVAAAVGDAATTVRRRHASPVVPVADNYDRLGYAPDVTTRDARYTRYLTRDLMLRSHTSSMLPAALEGLAASTERDVTLLCPGIVYRRDVIDRHHVGEPHQLDVWRIGLDPDQPLGEEDLDRLVATLVTAALPGGRWRTSPASHPYTTAGRQVDVEVDGAWLEIGECGLAAPAVLARAGLPAGATGLASGWGLDRLLMLRKGIDDIRLLRSTDPRVRAQMHDLEPYEPVSTMPAAVRDLSVAMDQPPDPELLGDGLRAALGPLARDVEAVEVVASTPGTDLPPQALQRLGMRQDQHNVLVRVVLRSRERTLTADEANVLRDHLYSHLHAGEVHHWAVGPPAP